MRRIIIVVFFSFFSLAYYAQADSIGVSVDQSVFAFSVVPGTTQDIKVKVKSLSRNVQKMSVVAQDFVVGNDNAISQLTQKNEQFGMKDWINTNQADWLLEPEQTQEVALKINVPSDATVGAHYSIVNIQALPQIDGQNFQQTIVGGQVGVYILTNVKGVVSGSGALSKFSTPVLARKDSQLQADFENTGNILYVPHGEISMQNMLTRKKTLLDIGKHFVFPGKGYSFSVSWSPESAFGIYKAQAIFVDADGVVHSSQRIIVGQLFFFIPLVLVTLFFFISRKVKKISNMKKQVRQEISKKKMRRII